MFFLEILIDRTEPGNFREKVHVIVIIFVLLYVGIYISRKDNDNRTKNAKENSDGQQINKSCYITVKKVEDNI